MNPKRLANDKAWGDLILTQERQGVARDLDDKDRVLFRTQNNLAEDGSGGQPRRGASSKWPHGSAGIQPNRTSAANKGECCSSKERCESAIFSKCEPGQ